MDKKLYINQFWLKFQVKVENRQVIFKQENRRKHVYKYFMSATISPRIIKATKT